jgi:hypothetical protein
VLSMWDLCLCKGCQGCSVLEVMVSSIVIVKVKCPKNILCFLIIVLCFAYNIH